MTRQYQYQQGHVEGPIKTRKGAAFRIRYRVPSANGKTQHRNETLYGLAGRKAARAVLEDRIKNLVSSPSNLHAMELTLREFIAAFWRPQLERKRLKPSTLSGYESALDCHILPHLGELRVADVAPLHIEDLVQKKIDGTLSRKTVRNVVMVLRSIFSLAVEQDVIPRSPVCKSHMPAIEKRARTTWTPEQVRKIISEAPLPYRALFVLVALTGVRQGELLALQWKHVDLSEGTLAVAQSLWRGRLVSPKTNGSVRLIRIGPALTEILSGHRQESLRTDEEDFVFCKSDGSPLHPDVLRKDVLYPILDRLGIQRAARDSGFHAFRHCVGSFVNEQTGNLKLAQALLGHSNLSTTADVYTHTSKAAERAASEALEKVIFGNLFQVVPRIGTWNNFSALCGVPEKGPGGLAAP